MSDSLTGLELAIIGMAVRFPGARDADGFWRNLLNGVESITFFSDGELELAPEQEALRHHPGYVRAASVLDGIDLFDSEFFGFSPREADITDPQHRVLLECAWEALENAACDPERFKGLIGIYAGALFNNYLFNVYSNPEILRSSDSLKLLFGNEKDYLVTRIAYKLNLEGPAVTVQTACSTSLVAVHLAGQALLTGECDMALAGGVAIKVPQKSGYLYREGEILSPDGHCRAFDARAQGTVFGNGAGLVVLRRLQDALDAGDPIRAVIKGSAINNDGSRKVGYTAPRAEGQAKVIRSAQVRSEVDPATITYVEAHGTGTPMGDPIEVDALQRVFRAGSSDKGFCALGAVKTNVGHLNTAAGVAGLAKVVLALENRVIPPTVHFERPLPALGLEDSPFYVPVRPVEWQTGAAPRRAAVSSFGIGGTNAHAILEEAPAPTPSRPARGWSLLSLAARSQAALEAMAANLAAHLRRHPELELEDVAHTLHVGRRAFPVRRSVVCRTVAEAVELLERPAPTPAAHAGAEQSLLFMFPGQGAQHADMARELHAGEPVFRHWLDRCADLLAPHLGLDLRRLLLAPPEQAAAMESQLDQTWLTQPALFAVEYALARLWMEWGIQPRAMIGHSVGEYVAACLAGVFSLEDALVLVAARGSVMQRLPGGAMLAVPLPEEEVRQILGDRLDLAAVNGPRRCVVAGPPEEIAVLERRLAAEGTECRRLRTSHAFHSAMMEPALAPFAEHLRRVRPKPPQVPFLSNLTGSWISAGEATDPAYWVRHLRETVRFGDGLRTFLGNGRGILLEAGPGHALSRAARQHPERTPDHLVIPSSRSQREEQPDSYWLLTALGRLWAAGIEPNWTAFHKHERRRRVALPTYPFERRRHWIERRGFEVAETRDSRRLSRNAFDQWFYVPSWKRSPAPDERSGGLEAPRSVLLLADGMGVGEALARRLDRLGLRVAVVRPEEAFVRRGAAAYGLDPRRPEHYTALLDDLAASGGLPDTLVHLWALEPAGGPEAEAGLAAGRLAFDSLVHLARAIGRTGVPGRLRIEVVTSGLHEVDGRETLEPAKALVLGPVRVIPREYPGVACRSIDVELPVNGGVEELAERLLVEMASPAAGSDADLIVAWRGRHRWVQWFEPLRLAEPPDPSPLRSRGVYLITGGFGGIGGVLAEHLARTAQARLALLGRSPLPDRAEWPARLTAGDPAAPAIRQVLRLEELGATVLPLQADVTRPGEVLAAVAAVRRELGAIQGVIHAAGVPGGGLLQLRSDAAIDEVLAPKVQGTLAVAAAVQGEPLDFFLLCSSSLALTGGLGQVDYCAANSFLDAFAHSRSRYGARTISVNWDAWRQVGMAARAERPGRSRGPLRHPLLERRAGETPGGAVFSTDLETSRHWILDEHRLLGSGLVPGTAYLEMMVAALAEQTGGGSFEIREAEFIAPLLVEDDERREVRVVLEGGEGPFAVRVVGRAAGEGGDVWSEHAAARAAALQVSPPSRADVAGIAARLEERAVPLDGESRGGGVLRWGPRWQSLRRLWVGDGEALAELRLADELAADLERFHLHPALLDVATSFGAQALGVGTVFPLSYGRLTVNGRLPGHLYSHTRRVAPEGERADAVCFDVTLLAEDGTEVARVEDFTMQRVGPSSVTPAEVAARRPMAPVSMAAAGVEGEEEGILPEEGAAAFGRILSREGLPQVAVVVRALAALRERALAPSAAIPPAAPRDDRAPAHARPQLSSTYVAPRRESERIIAGIWEGLLGIEQVGIHDNFFELGGDSVTGIQVFARAVQAGLPLTTSQLLQLQTVAELAAAADAAAEGDTPGSRPAAPAAAAGVFPVPSALDAASGDSYSLSPAQEGMLFHALYEPGAGVYLDQLSCRLASDGPLDAGLFQRTFEEVARRHPALRSAMHWRDGERPCQIVMREVALPVEEEDWSGLPPAEQEDRLAALLRADRERGFDLSSAPLMRLRLARLGETRYQLLLTYHHIILDAWSMFLVLKEVFDTYGDLRWGRSPARRETPRPYRDYIDWLGQQDLAECAEAWRRMLAGFSAPTPLGIGREAAAGSASPEGRQLRVRLAAPATAALQTFARRHRLTSNTLVQGAWALLLSRYGSAEDIVFGTTVSGRPPDLLGVETMVGLFINTLPLRVQAPPSGALLPWLEELQTRQFELLQLAHSPLVEIQGWSEVPRGTPLFESLVVFENVPIDAALREQPADLGFRIEDVAYTPRTNYPLSLLAAAGDELSLELLFDPRRFDTAAIVRLQGHLVSLLDALPRAGGERLRDLPLLTAAERHQVEREWNDTRPVSPQEQRLHRLVAAQAAWTPDAVAVHGSGQALTYEALVARAGRLAQRLRGLGVGPESLVAVCLERGVDMLVALLGVLEAGGAYVPLDPEYPRDRLFHMLDDSGAAVLLTHRSLAGHLLGREVRQILLDSPWDATTAEAPAPGTEALPDNLAYVIYTSGSTGLPKGVQISHRALASFLRSMAERPGMAREDVLLAVTSLSFDIAGLELFLPLRIGARVEIAGPETARDAAALAAALASSGATVMQATPSTWRLLAESGWRPGPGVRALCGGEALPRELASRVLQAGAALWNLYGPTETTIWSAVERVGEGDAGVPIGRPIADTGLHVLDAELRPAPIGVPGELFIAGGGLARGYLGRPGQTAERFLPSPLGAPSGGRLYRTGDLVRRLDDGSIEFLGRVDHQVKVRGFRIELGEIEATLERHPAVRSAAVLAVDHDQGDRRLAAFVVPRDEALEDAGDSRVAGWQRVWSEVYGRPSHDGEPGLDLAGWNSSYTGRPIPDEEMREWVEGTVARLRSLAPRRVLEIGCGTGLLLRRLAGEVELYWGTDLSAEALAHVERSLSGGRKEVVHLMQRPADDFSGVAEASFDAVVLNSVAQYFPDAGYLLRVLEGALRAVAPGGVIFVGDLRSLPLLEAFWTSVHLHQAGDGLPLAELRERVRRSVATERELLVDPALFEALRQEWPAIGRVEIQLRRGRFHNELTRFRYDAVLHVGPAVGRLVEPLELVWDESLSLDSLRRRLDGDALAVRVRGLPNARLGEAVAAVRWLDEESFETVDGLRRAVRQGETAGVEPEELWSLGEGGPWAVEIAWSEGAGDRFDAVFRRRSAPGEAEIRLVPKPVEARPWNAYVTPRQRPAGHELEQELRLSLKEKLPAYMLPTWYLFLESLPLTPNRKVDRRALVALAAAESGGPEPAAAAPRSDTEELLAGLWSELLRIPRVGAHDGFFDLGGHSLLATQLLARLRHSLGVEVSLQELFGASTIAGLAAIVESRLRGGGRPLPSVERSPESGPAPLTFVQQRLWFIDQLTPGDPSYNIPYAVRLAGHLDVPAFTRALGALVERHESLRTRFVLQQRQPVQVVEPPVALELPLVDLSALAEGPRRSEVLEVTRRTVRRPFVLAQAPLIRALLIRSAAEEHTVVFAVHHIVCDGWSMGILAREITAFYAAGALGTAPSLPELPLRYSDFARWQQAWLREEALEELLAYWLRQLESAPLVLELPTDFPRPLEQSHQGAIMPWRFSPPLRSALAAVERSEGVTLFMVLLASFEVLLRWYAGIDDFVVGTDVANRNRFESEGLMGCFVNQLPLRARLQGCTDFRQLLRQVRETTLGAHAHQDVPFEKLVERLRLERSLAYTPLVQVKLNLHNFPHPDLELPGLTLQPVEVGFETAKLDLIVDLVNRGEELAAACQYRSSLFEPATIERLLRRFGTLLERVAEDPGVTLSDLERLLEEADRTDELLARDQLKTKRSRVLRDKAKPLSLQVAGHEERPGAGGL